MLKIPLHTRLLSFLYPALIRRKSSAHNPILELILYKNQYQLATDDALYSDGHRYKPMLIAFKQLDSILPELKNVLVLGTGLASAVQILSRKGYRPSYTLIDNDPDILDWALELLPDDQKQNLKPVCADAMDFVRNTPEKYDLIIIDIFKGCVVPEFVTSNAFLEQCNNCLTANGHIVMNYIVNPDKEAEKDMNRFCRIFPGSKQLKYGINRIIIR